MTGMSDRVSSGNWLVPALISGLLHGVAMLMLWGGWWQEPAVNTQPARVQTQLLTLTYEMAEPEPVVELPAVEPPLVVEPPSVEPPPSVDHAVIARQRLQEQQEKEQRERAQQQREQQKIEQQRQQKIREQQLAEEKRQQELYQQELRQQEQQAQEEQQRLVAEAEAARREAETIAQYQPINKAPPVYPRRALDSKIEGDCTVSYTVTSDGRVSQPKVIDDACDDQIFIRPSLQAASAFRYQPRIVNGRAVVVHDVRNTFRYRIQP